MHDDTYVHVAVGCERKTCIFANWLANVQLNDRVARFYVVAQFDITCEGRICLDRNCLFLLPAPLHSRPQSSAPSPNPPPHLLVDHLHVLPSLHLWIPYVVFLETYDLAAPAPES